MATGKRYYWIKLKESFMTSDAVDFLMGQTNGAQYVVLYQMLCLKTINTGGRLERHIGEVIIPYDEAKIQRDCKYFSADTVRVALNLYKALGLVYTDNGGALCLTDYDNLVGSETDYAEKNRRMRAQQALPTGHNVSTDVSSDVSENVSTDIDIDIRDKEIDICLSLMRPRLTMTTRRPPRTMSMARTTKMTRKSTPTPRKALTMSC